MEIRYDYVKIPEQNLAIFFFYKAFVKDNLLSFETLLKKYFNENKNRFKDCVIPANNTFGFENVMQKLQPILRNYLKSIENRISVEVRSGGADSASRLSCTIVRDRLILEKQHQSKR